MQLPPLSRVPIRVWQATRRVRRSFGRGVSRLPVIWQLTLNDAAGDQSDPVQ